MFSFFSKHEKGQGLVEYAIILSLVAIVVIGVMKLMGPKVCNTFNTINSSLPGASSNSNNCGGSQGLNSTFTNTWTGCSGACTDTSFSCTPGSSFTISYTASSYGGSTGSSPHHSCSGGGTAGAGNFFPQQVVTITDEATGQTQTYTIPNHP